MSAMMVTAVVYPTQRAEAWISLAVGAGPGAILGAAVLAVNGTAHLALYNCQSCKSWSNYKHIMDFFPLGYGIGFNILDGENGQEIQFAKIESAETAKSIGLTDSELSAYNQELDTINLINQEVASQLQGDSQQDIEKARAAWLSHQADLSPEAFSAMTKVAQSAAQAAQKAR
jgi:hypothetical protein